MKKIAFIILIMVPTFLVAQKKEIKLKNGSVVVGKVLVKNDSIIKIKTKNDCVWVYPISEVKSISEYDYIKNQKGKYYSNVLFGLMPGLPNYYSLFHVTNGYRFNSHWKFGFVMGIDKIYNKRYIPLLFETEFNFFNQNTSPFLLLNSGYDLPLSGNYEKGGFTGAIHFGLNHFFSKHVGIKTSVGYRFAYLKTQHYYWDDFITIREINRFEIKFGLTIN